MWNFIAIGKIRFTKEVVFDAVLNNLYTDCIRDINLLEYKLYNQDQP